MTSTIKDRRTRRIPRHPRGESPTPVAPQEAQRGPGATAVATGSLGTGTAVDEETTLMGVPEPPDVEEGSVVPEESRAPAPTAVPVAAVATGASVARRDPYRPIGIALAAILVALAGIAVLSSGGDTPAQIGAPPAATTAPPANPGAAQDDDKEKEHGKGHGKGQGHGNGHGGGRSDD